MQRAPSEGRQGDIVWDARSCWHTLCQARQSHLTATPCAASKACCIHSSTCTDRGVSHLDPRDCTGSTSFVMLAQLMTEPL